jgi:hypothetical protein
MSGAVTVTGGVVAIAETVAATVAMWVSVPEVPVKVIEALPAAAVEPAVSVKLCAAPGVSISVAGLVVTPAGRPLSATDTVLANPLEATAVTLTCCPDPPAVSATVLGVEVSEKSAAGVGVEVFCCEL